MSAGIRKLPDVGAMLGSLTGIPGVRHVVVASEDGLRLGHATAEGTAGGPARLETSEAEAVAATCAGLTATGRSASQLLLDDQSVRQMMVETAQGFVLLTDAGAGAQLVVATDVRADVGLIAHEMQVLVVQIGSHLSSLPREDPVTPSP